MMMMSNENIFPLNEQSTWLFQHTHTHPTHVMIMVDNDEMMRDEICAMMWGSRPTFFHVFTASAFYCRFLVSMFILCIKCDMAGNLSECWRDDDDDNGQEERYRVHTQVNVGKVFFFSNDIRLMECNKKERKFNNMRCFKEAISSGWMARRCESLCSLLTFCSEPLTLESWTNRKKQCCHQSYTFSDCASTTYLSEGGKQRESPIRSLIKLHSTLILGVKWTFTCKQERRVKNLHECSSKSELMLS